MPKDFQDESPEPGETGNKQEQFGDRGRAAMAGETDADQTDVPLGQPGASQKLIYEIGSPHDDYRQARALEEAQRRHELGQAAATADSLPDAINTTLEAHRGARASGDTAQDEWFYLKHGRTPYTTMVRTEEAPAPGPPFHTEPDAGSSRAGNLGDRPASEPDDRSLDRNRSDTG